MSRNVFAVLCIATRYVDGSQTNIQTGIIWHTGGNSGAEAEGEAMRKWREEYPSKDGWQNHFVSAAEMPENVRDFVKESQ